MLYSSRQSIFLLSDDFTVATEVVRVGYFLWWALEELLFYKVGIIMHSGGPLEESCRVILCVCVCVSSYPPKL